MRYLTLLLITAALLVGIFLLPAHSSSRAQTDGTPGIDRLLPTATWATASWATDTWTADPLATAAPASGTLTTTHTTNVAWSPSVVSLPFSDSFDNVDHWRPSGVWQYGLNDGEVNLGWWIDGTRRETISTLTYRDRIDLSGALSAQLIYRQKSNLPKSDLISVDVSLDGGNSWYSIDQQSGLETDWELRAVDLTKYRGLVISLRFRTNTGTPVSLEPEVELGYWIDDLSIQFALNQPNLVFDTDHSGPHTLMGLHLVVGANKDAVLSFVRRLNDSGWPLGTLKGTSSTEDILNAVAEISPETVIVYRSLLTPLGMRDCPDTTSDPVSAAAEWMEGVQPYWSAVNADYYELVNECLPPAEWMIPFTIESMRLAAAQGQCLLVFSFAVGNPEPQAYSQLLPIYEYALQNPCQPGRYHGIALHAYGVHPNTLLSESGIYIGYRHRLYYTLMVPEAPNILRIPVYLTEAGTGDGIKKLSCSEVSRDIIQYTQQIELDGYIRGFHFWNVGGVGTQWVDYTDCLPTIGDALLHYYDQKEP